MNPSTTTARPILIIAALVAVIAGLLSMAPAQADPRASADVVGTWRAGLGEVTVTGSGGSYTGTVSKTITGFMCSHPVGETIWAITGSGPEYSGQARFDLGTGCPGPMSNASFVLLGSDMLQVNFVGPTGLSATLYIAQRVASPTPDDEPSTGPDTTAPVVEAVAPSETYSSGQRIPLEYRVTDDSGKAKVNVAIFSDGAKVAGGQSPGFVTANGRVRTVTTSKPLKATPAKHGPYYFCVTARDKAGNVSEPSCSWLPIEIPISLVANGCGGAQWGDDAVTVQNWLLDKHKYGGVAVSFREACNAHDAGYAGVVVRDPMTDDVTDFRTWSRQDVDDKFFDDLRKLCEAQLVDTKGEKYLEECQNGMTVLDLAALTPAELVVPWIKVLKVGAYSYYDAVRRFAVAAYDADATTDGGQESCVTDTRLPDNCRNNS